MKQPTDERQLKNKKMNYTTWTASIFLFFMVQTSFAQQDGVTVTGTIRDQADKTRLSFVNVLLFQSSDSSFVQGVMTDGDGQFTMEKIKSGEYFLNISFLGFQEENIPVRVGRLSPFLDLGTLYLSEGSEMLDEVLVTGRREEVASNLDRKSILIEDNISQLGGSVLQAMANLPGVTIDRDGKVVLRGSDQVAVLIDGKQTALTGFGEQQALDNIPASAVERIEIINNPSARYDATGMAGIVNIIFKKETREGWNGKVGLTTGLGALGEKRENLPGIRDQYRFTPKVNPSASVNYKKDQINFFFMGDVLYHQQMMRNEFITRTYEDGRVINQQFLENRTQPIYNLKTGLDWSPNEKNLFTFSGLFNYRAYIDLGDLPYFDGASGERVRLWQYYEEEVNQTLLASIAHKYQFKQPGRTLETTFNYSFRRKDEVFYFDNFIPSGIGTDTTSLIADENVYDLTVDYTRPLRSGRYELGTKQRARIFPNFITFTPGINSILDPTLAGSAEYREWLSAIYGNYVWESPHFEIEAGLRVEYAQIDYLVDPNHSVYESDGFSYLEPFPNLRLAWLISDNSNLSLFYNRRVDRPEEKALRVFPTYADPEILRLGNPTLIPQFSQSMELGYKRSWNNGYIYGAAYYRYLQNILTFIITSLPESTNLASIDQNAGNGTNIGIEAIYNQQLYAWLKMDINTNIYRNVINAFTIVNAYPTNTPFSMEEQRAISGNIKANFQVKLPHLTTLQITGIYLAPDLVPQGTIDARYALDFGIKRSIQSGRGELFMNVTDLFNTMIMRYELMGTDFRFRSTDYFETQAVRIGYQYRF